MTKSGTTRKVAVLGAFPKDVRDALEPEVDFVSPEELAGLPEQAVAGIVLGLTSAMGGADKSVIERLPGLRRIASVGAGIDLFDLPWLEARGIELCPTPDVMTEDTAECAVALAMAAMRNVAANDRFMRSGGWATGRAPLGRRLSGARAGIVGLGRIGGRIAEKLSALGCTVAYTGRQAKPVPWHFEPDLLRLAAESDLLVLSCAGGADTRHLASAALFEALGPQGYLVNVSRGSVVDEEALIAALRDGRIAGAGLDVFENEPTPDERFLSLERCVLSPHAAVYTRQNRVDLIRRIRDIANSTL
ncbi:NAD(P)-dependent oxidoreductase [Frigidibacter oleivorans]|uniref:NAD(P)-dependent oxidoreductase n=1 Tax=Frigidibacter oleivorans TaxID=2487129 RepID=UPI0013DF97D9|nr:NAD(P)-dependent oxidoreductase [Frigidibacter oleivorans]